MREECNPKMCKNNCTQEPNKLYFAAESEDVIGWASTQTYVGTLSDIAENMLQKGNIPEDFVFFSLEKVQVRSELQITIVE